MRKAPLVIQCAALGLTRRFNRVQSRSQQGTVVFCSNFRPQENKGKVVDTMAGIMLRYEEDSRASGPV